MKFLSLLFLFSFSLYASNAELVKELEELSKKLSSSELTQEQSKAIEGKIKTIKEMMKASEDKKAVLKSVDKNHYSCQSAQALNHILVLTKSKDEDIKMVEEFKRFICNYAENPAKDVFYPSGRQAYNSESGIWSYPNGDVAYISYEGSWIYPNGVFAHTDYDEDWYYPNGSVAYSNFYENWYYPNGVIAYESYSNNWSFSTGKRAYTSAYELAFFPNEKTFETKVTDYGVDSLVKSLMLFGLKDVSADQFKDIKDPELKMLVQITWLSTLL
jgi:hypothetical protein